MSASYRLADIPFADKFATPAAVLVALIDDPTLGDLPSDRPYLHTLQACHCLSDMSPTPLGQRVSMVLRSVHGLDPPQTAGGQLMCNHYRQAILKGEQVPGWSIDQFSEIKIPLRFHNIPVDVFPDREGLVIRLLDGKPEIEAMRWGFPPPPTASTAYVTNVRNTKSSFWKPWLKETHRCLVPVTQFAEPDPEKPKPRAERWFARPDGLPMFFAGIWREWDGDRGPKSKPVKGPHLLFSFLTTEPNAVVAPIHPKAMPVIIAPEDANTWLIAPPAEAMALQRPAPEDALLVLARDAA